MVAFPVCPGRMMFCTNRYFESRLSAVSADAPEVGVVPAASVSVPG